jgi:hypothetical protein
MLLMLALNYLCHDINLQYEDLLYRALYREGEVNNYRLTFPTS